MSKYISRPRPAVLTFPRKAYVDMKRLIYDPEGKQTAKPAASVVPSNPYQRGPRPFNAWAENLVGDHGFPLQPSTSAQGKSDNKRKALDEPEITEREILFNGVTFTAKKGNGGKIEIVDEATVGTGPDEWVGGKVLRFVISKKDGTTDGAIEGGEYFNHGQLKTALFPICKPAFVAIIAAEPEADATSVDRESSDFPARATAPPTIQSAAAVAAASIPGGQDYPAKGQASFRDTVTDEIFATLKSTLGTWEGRTIEWVRASRKCPCSVD